MMYLWYLPLCQNLHVISTDENRVVAAVQEWNQNETYNLYVSDTSGVYYTLALENVVSSMGPEGNVMVDLYEVNKHRPGRNYIKSVLHVSCGAESAHLSSLVWDLYAAHEAHPPTRPTSPWVCSIHFIIAASHKGLPDECPAWKCIINTDQYFRAGRERCWNILV